MLLFSIDGAQLQYAYRKDEAKLRHDSKVTFLYHLYFHNLHYCRKFCDKE